jgi:hypothetical protein
MGDGPQTRIHNALRIAEEDGGTDGAHHKQWVIDQMVRALCGQRRGYHEPTVEYLAWVNDLGEEWDEGVAP